MRLERAAADREARCRAAAGLPCGVGTGRPGIARIRRKQSLRTACAAQRRTGSARPAARPLPSAGANPHPGTAARCAGVPGQPRYAERGSLPRKGAPDARQRAAGGPLLSRIRGSGTGSRQDPLRRTASAAAYGWRMPCRPW
ncbi:hypothetical protein GCM10027440_33610 [Nocardiopsis coralliicola]